VARCSILVHLLLLEPACTSKSSHRPLNPASLAKDVAHALSLVRPSHVAVYPNKLQDLKAAFQQLGWEGSSTPKVFTVIERTADYPLFPEDVEGHGSAEKLPIFEFENGHRSAKDVTAMIVFSSGTTGKIKGVQLSHYNIVSNMIQTRASMPSMANCMSREVFFPPCKTSICHKFRPFLIILTNATDCHVYGLGTIVLATMWHGSFACAIPSFDLDLFCRKMEEYKATWAHIVPPVAIMLASSDVAAKYDLSHLKLILISAAPTKRDLQMKLKARFGEDTKVVQGKPFFVRCDIVSDSRQVMACPNAVRRCCCKARKTTKAILARPGSPLAERE
jgi:4-coumarate--CoA ligase